MDTDRSDARPSRMTARVTSRASQSQPKGRVYLFVVVVSSVFIFSGFLLSDPPRLQFEPVSANIVYRGAAEDASQVLGPKAVNKIVSPDNLRVTVSSLTGLDDPSKLKELITGLQQGLKIVHRPHDERGESQVHIEYGGPMRIGASVVNRMARDYVDQYHKNAEATAHEVLKQAEGEAAHVGAAAQQARNILHVFVHEHFRDLESNGIPDDERHVAKVSQNTSAAADPDRLLLNPKWAELNKRLSELRQEYSQHRERLTPRHPILLNLESRIVDVNLQLAHQPRQVEVPVEVPVHDPDSASERLEITSLSSPVVENRGDPSGDTERFAKLRSESERIDRQFARYQAQVEKARNVLLEKPQTQLYVAKWASLRPVIKRVQEPPPLMPAILIAVTCGAGLANFGRARRHTIESVSSAERVFAVPVVGVIAANEDTPNPEKTPMPLWARSVMIASEFVLIVVVICIAILVLIDPAFLDRLLQNPLAEVIGTLHQVRNLFPS